MKPGTTPPLDDAGIIAIAIVMLLAGMALVLIVIAAVWMDRRARARHAHKNAASELTAPEKREPNSRSGDPEDEPWFRVTLWMLMVAGFILIIMPDARAEEKPGFRPVTAGAATLTAPEKRARKIILDIADCPPQTERDTAIVMFIVDTSAELRAGRVPVHCSRMAHRKFHVAPRKSAKEK